MATKRRKRSRAVGIPKAVKQIADANGLKARPAEKDDLVDILEGVFGTGTVFDLTPKKGK